MAEIRNAPLASIKDEHVVDKNYSLGAPLSGRVGDPIVRMKDYFVSTTTLPVVVPSKSGEVHAGLVGTIDIHEGLEHRICGEIEIEGKALLAVQLPGTGRCLTIAQSGVPSKTLLSCSGCEYAGSARIIATVIGKDFQVTPSDIVFFPKTSSSLNSKAGFTNFEILYSGKSGSSLFFVYREYTPDNMARPAFSQNLTYEADAKIIRYRDVKIEVLSATSETIDYRVLED